MQPNGKPLNGQNGWASQPMLNTLATAADTVTLVLAGPKERTDVWYALLAQDPRFRVTTYAHSFDDLKAKLLNPPEALVLDGSLASGPQSLADFVANLQVPAVYLVIPPLPNDETETALLDRLNALPHVKATYKLDVNLSVLVEQMHSDVRAARALRTQSTGDSWGAAPALQGNAPSATRIVSVWNQMGGVGKTTIATNLAYEAARRGYPTLLIGLGAPDDLPLILGLKMEPNLTHWQANPNVAGLKLAVQKVDALDVLGGFPDVLSEAHAMQLAPDAHNSIKKLVETAIYAGYAMIILDTPPTALAATAMTVSNTLVIVGRATLEGVWRTTEAYRTVSERLAGLHPIHSIYCILNRMQSGEPGYDAATWHQMASTRLGRPFPPVLAQIADDPLVTAAQNGRVLPVNRSESFRRSLGPLLDTLSAPAGRAVPAPAPAGKQLKFGPIKVRI